MTTYKNSYKIPYLGCTVHLHLISRFLLFFLFHVKRESIKDKEKLPERNFWFQRQRPHFRTQTASMLQQKIPGTLYKEPPQF